MKRPFTLAIVVMGILCGMACLWPEFIVNRDYLPPKKVPEEELTDDRLEDKAKVPFDAALVDRRPLGEWQINASAAVVRLDIAPLKPDTEADLQCLYPSYQAAVEAAKKQHGHDTLLPSVNMLAGKAKQFDDGLVAALDQAYHRGVGERLHSQVDLVRRLYDTIGKDSEAAPFLAAALHLAGVRVEVADQPKRDSLLAAFNLSESLSKPVGFYTWNETLSRCFRFERFLQHEFRPEDIVPLALARALEQHPDLLAEHRKAVAFHARLTNPSASCLAVSFLIGQDSKKPVAFFPASSFPAALLFEKLFPMGVPAHVNLMDELIRRIRTGDLDLHPGPNSGWYDYQVHALETLLLPEKGEENNKLLLTKAYKKRMMEAFKALVTTQIETHLRSPFFMGCTAPPPLRMPETISPRLRVEPCPNYFLRTARAYAFLSNFLETTVGDETLRSLHGLREKGERKTSLHADLHFMRDLFYGLYLVNAEDIGLKPAFHKEEPVDAEKCYRLATDWLPTAFDDQDMRIDTRVAVSLLGNPNVTRIWATLGVRMARLESEYVRPPSLRPAPGGGDWTVVEPHRLGKASYLIPVDEFAEVELLGQRALSREELRTVCQQKKTKAAIVTALQRVK